MVLFITVCCIFRVKTGGAGAHIKKLDAKKLNKQLRIVDKGWSFFSFVGWRDQELLALVNMLQIIAQSLGLGRVILKPFE
jgi:galactitol-specific phosphotransferase system IIC component